MGVVFNGSSRFLLNSAPAITAYPFTIGFWFNSTTVAVGQADMWALSSGSGNAWVGSRNGAAVQFWDGTASVTTGTIVANTWNFAIFRAISSTNRRVSLLTNAGAATHAQTTGASTPTTINQFAIGCAETLAGNFFSGLIDKFWYADVDIQPGGLQLDDALLRRLAYNGVFSAPEIAKDLIEYRSFKSSIGTGQERGSEVYHGKRGRQTWANTTGVTIGESAPVLHEYRSPLDKGAPMIRSFLAQTVLARSQVFILQ